MKKAQICMTFMLCGHQMQLELEIVTAINRAIQPDARTHDPASSHINVRRIKTNKGLAKLVLTSIQAAYTIKNEPVNDDDLLAQAELLSATRQQRNVLAKVRVPLLVTILMLIGGGGNRESSSRSSDSLFWG